MVCLGKGAVREEKDVVSGGEGCAVEELEEGLVGEGFVVKGDVEEEVL